MKRLLVLGLAACSPSYVYQVSILPKESSFKFALSGEAKNFRGVTFVDGRKNGALEFQQGFAKIQVVEGNSFEETILKDVKALYTNSGFNTADPRSKIFIRVVLEDIYAARSAGMMITAVSHVKVKIEIVDSAGASLFFSKSFRGSDKKSYAMGSLSILDESLGRSWGQCLEKMSSDVELASASYAKEEK